MSPESKLNPLKQEEYGLSGTLSQHMMAERRAAHQAAFLLPHLRPGMHLLDCGCGSGSITLGLARQVAPGLVIGIDQDTSEIERARAMAAEQGLTNVQFESGNVYDLQFEDGKFDAIFSNAVLDHLREPLTALREMKRVLKPGGVIGVRTADRDGYLIAPANEAFEKFGAWSEQLKTQQGVSVRLGKNLRAMLGEVGFVRTEASASYDSYGTLEKTRGIAEGFAARLSTGRFAEQIIEQGWADQAELDALATSFQAWGASPDAFIAQSLCEAVGWSE